MSFSIMNDDMEIVGKLGDEPNEDDGLDAAGLKAVFDQAGKLCKAAINKLIAELHNTAAAASVGFSRSASVPADNVQDAIVNVQQQIAGVSQGAVPNNSITTEKLLDGAVTGDKMAGNTLAETVNVSDAMHLVSTEGTSAESHLNLHYIHALGMVFMDGYISVVPSAAEAQTTIFEFDHYAPKGAPGTTWQFPLITTSPDTEQAHFLSVSGSKVRLVVDKNAKGYDVGNANRIDMWGWYFCDGEGS